MNDIEASRIRRDIQAAADMADSIIEAERGTFQPLGSTERLANRIAAAIREAREREAAATGTQREGEGASVFTPLPVAATEDAAVKLEWLRDRFAAEASRGAADVLCDMLEPDDLPQAFDPVARMADVKRHAAQHAMAAYLYADAMLAARKL